MELGLAGRAAIVTGASKGLGKAIAEELAGEGTNVSICSRDPAEIESAAQGLRVSGVMVHSAVCDVTDRAAVRTYVAEAVDALGGLDILVNNAGRAFPGTFETISDEDLEHDFSVKVLSIIRCSREAAPHMRARGGGRIINLNAVFGKSPDPGFFATSVNRAAGQSLTKVLAMQLAADNILVNGVNIGYVITPQWENIRLARAPDLSRGEFFGQWAQKEVPLGRFGRPDEVAGLVAFLAGSRSSYITGASIDVAGGMGRYL